MAGAESERTLPEDSCLFWEWTAQKANESNKVTEDFPRWLDSMMDYVKKTGIKTLNLQDAGLVPENIKSVLSALLDSHSSVTELDLGDNNLENGIEELSEILRQTKIQKLKINDCEMLDDDLLVLFRLLRETLITELDISANMIELEANEMSEIVSQLLNSQLRTLKMAMNYFTSLTSIEFLVRKLPDTYLTCLNLSSTGFSYETILDLLFSLLPTTSITDLSLSSNGIQDKTLISLSQNLRKLVKLDLSMNKITDVGVDCLAEGLADSKLTILNLNGNKISGLNHLFRYLKRTQIQRLDLGSNQIVSPEMFDFPDFLKETAIITLDVSHCQLGDAFGQELMINLKSTALTTLTVCGNHLQVSSISKLARVISDTNLVEIDLSSNDLQMEAFIILGDCLKESKLESIDVSMSCNQNAGVGLYYLLEQTKHTGVTTLNFSGVNIFSNCCEPLSKILSGTTLTSLDLSHNQINGKNVASLAWCLKHTCISRLDLSRNNIDDTGIKVLAECLKETKIEDLDISFNLVTSHGAELLARSIKGTHLRSLKLRGNKIEDHGLEMLADGIRETYVTFLDIYLNPVSRILLLDGILWQNELASWWLVTFFKEIVHESSEGDLVSNFDVSLEKISNLQTAPRSQENQIFYRLCELSSGNILKLLIECFHFYREICTQPSALVILTDDKSVSSTKQQLSAFFREEFPRQLVAFIELNFQSSGEHYEFILQEAKRLGLEIIVELLLSKRSLFAGDK